MKMKDIISPEC